MVPIYSTTQTILLYRWDPVSGALSVNGATTLDAPDTDTIFMTIWDGGGIDTYDFSNYSGHTSGIYVDLRPGGWTTFSPNQLADLDGLTGDRFAAVYNGNPQSWWPCYGVTCHHSLGDRRRAQEER